MNYQNIIEGILNGSGKETDQSLDKAILREQLTDVSDKEFAEIWEHYKDHQRHIKKDTRKLYTDNTATEIRILK